MNHLCKYCGKIIVIGAIEVPSDMEQYRCCKYFNLMDLLRLDEDSLIIGACSYNRLEKKKDVELLIKHGIKKTFCNIAKSDDDRQLYEKIWGIISNLELDKKSFKYFCRRLIPNVRAYMHDYL